VNPKNPEPKVADNKDVKHNENDDKFEYKIQLNSFIEMGFDNVETIKFLLIKHKGATERVIEELLQA